MKVALVTGGSRGIGLAVVRALRADGLRVAAASRSGAAPEADLALACDVRDEAAVRRAVEETRAQLGGLDVVVAAAGVAESAPLARTDTALWERMIGVNLTGTFFVLRETLPLLQAQRSGRFVAIASTAAKAGDRYIAAYAASKHGVLGLIRSAAREVAEAGVTVNAVCPAYVETEMTARTLRTIVERTGKPEAEARRLLEARSPQKRLYRPEEVAAVVRFLASDAAAGVNGQALNLCGGELPV
jgi:NAD(P)-dependent dehydrogenase (short-subunit alcohol dehydrogenase family)